MKTAVLIARILLGLMFVIFGLNGFIHFIPMPAPTGQAGQYMGALFSAHILSVVFLIQLLSGALLLANRFVPIALVMLGPVIVNILLYHVFLEPAGVAPGIMALVLWSIVFWSVRSAFASVLAMQTRTEEAA